MSLKRKILNFFTAIVMVFGNVPFTFSNAYAAEPAGEAPRSSKTVKANGDGTYDITLEIEGVSSQKTDVTKANVVVVYDTSGSMKYPEPSTEFGRYGYSISNGYEIDTDNYVDLYYQSGTDWYGRPTYELVGDNDNHSTVYTRSWSYWENDWVYSVYDNPRYSNKNATQTRASVAETALNSLAEQLLANNDPSNEKTKDIVEMAFVDFSTQVNSSTTHTTAATGAPTTDLTTFKSWVTAAKPKDGNNGGTNWEAALNAANGVSFNNDGDDTYVIFISDGDPTFRTTRHCTGRNCSDSDDTNNTPNGVHGNGNSDPQEYNLSDAQTVAGNIVSAGKTLYAVGVFGDADNMRDLNASAIYKDATNQQTLNAAFADIVNKITMGLSVADLQITDGITAATSTSVTGNAGAFRYDVPESWGDSYKEAEFKNGSVTWDPGEDKTLSNGEKASVTFTVWPSQEATNCIADIKNGKGCDKDLSAFGLREENGTYSLITNTTASFKYRTATTVEGETTPTLSNLSDDVQIPEERDDTTLPESLLSVSKVWADQMQNGKRTDRFGEEIKLTLFVDGTEVKTFTLTGNNEGDEWTSSEAKWAIAPGVMKKLNGAEDPLRSLAGKRIVTVEGEEYIILEEGHDYVFTENKTDSHYKMTKYSFHPMIVDDGKIHDVIFDGTTATIDSVEMTKLFAENTLNGGIRILKKVVNNGVEDSSIDDTFTIDVTLNNVADDYAGNYEISHADKTETKGTFTGKTFSVSMKQSDTVTVKDVDDGTTFSVSETLPAGYVRNNVEYKLIDYNDNEATTTGTDAQIVHGNMSSTVTVTNYLESGSLKISKTVVNENGDTNAISGKTFTFNVLVNGANYKTVELKDGEDVTLNNIPADAKYSVSEVNTPLGFTASETTLEGTIEKGKTAEASFSNTYSVEPTNQLKNLELRAAKGFDNFWNKLGEGEGFTFVLTDQQTGKTYDSEILNALNNNVATFNFANLGIKIDSFGTGEYKYIISEKTPTVKGVSRVEGDADIYVTVKVKDDGFGQLSLDSVKYAKGETAEGDATEKNNQQHLR